MSKIRSSRLLSAAIARIVRNAARMSDVDAASCSWRRPALFTGTTVVSLALAMPAAAEVCDAGNTIVVDGSGGGTQASPWNLSNALIVGQDGECTIVVQNGGEVNPPFNTGTVTIGQNAGSEGTLEVTGAGSAVTLSGTGSVTQRPGIFVGYRGTGTMTISDGGYVTSYSGNLGYDNGSLGIVTVTGAGSRWDASDISVGGTGATGGEGRLTIEDGGVVRTTGTVSVGHTGVGSLLVSGAGSQLEMDTEFRVAYTQNAQGTATITQGAELISTRGSIGEFGTGAVTISEGATWTLQDVLSIGGKGTLQIVDGGIVTMAPSTLTKSVRVGSAGTGIGRLEISGSGSLLSFDDTLHVAYSIPAELRIADGGRVESARGSIGTTLLNEGAGQAVVTGSDSYWVVTDYLDVGNWGDLIIEDGGVVQSRRALVGVQPIIASDPAVGTATVKGEESMWIVDQALIVGREGRGTLTITDQGVVRVGTNGVASGGTGPVTIARDSGSVGVLNLGAAEGEPAGLGTLGAASITFGAGDGTFVINHAAPTLQFAADISGRGTIRHVAGNTILSGANSGFTGTTFLLGGELSIQQRLGGNIQVEGGRLSGGEIGGTVIATGGTIAPGHSPGIMTIGGDLLLNASSVLEFELGSPTGTAGVDSDLIEVAGNLTLDGTLNIIDVGGFGEGLYRLIDYGGTLTDNGLDIGSVPAGYDASNLTVQTSVLNQVNLLVGPSAVSPEPETPTLGFMWDGSNTTANGAVDGGTGTWTATATNWTTADGGANGVFDSTTMLIFAGEPGVVTVDDSDGPIALHGGMQFAVDGYSIEGDAIRLDAATTVRVGDGTAAGESMLATIDASLTGTGRLTKRDLGTLVLTGNNSYSGGTSINAGTLRVAADAALGAAAGGIVLDGGTLAFASAMTSARSIAVDTNGGTLRLEGGNVTLSGTLFGAGALTKRGAGVLRYTGDGSDFTGELALAEGGLRLDGKVAGFVVTSSGTTLSGSGEIGSLYVGGRIEPGASIGTLVVTAPEITPPYMGLPRGGSTSGAPAVGYATAATAVAGHLTLASGSTYVVELDDGGNVAGVNNDLIVADTGTIESGVTIHVRPENGTDNGSSYTPGTVYTVIRTSAQDALTVDADPTITDDFALLNFIGHTDGQNYYLTSERVARFCLPHATFNQCSTANAVQALGAGHAAYDAVLLVSEAEVDAAFDAMSGEVYASNQHVVDQTLALFNRTLRYQSVAGIGAGNVGADVAATASGTQASAGARGAWAAPLGAYGRLDADGNAARVDWWNAGIAGGYESAFDVASGRAIGGVGFGYIRSRGDIDDRRSELEGDGFYLGAYAARVDGPVALAASLSYGANRTSTERGIIFGTVNETARAEYWTHSVGLSAEAAYAFELSPATKLAPLVTLDASWSTHGSFEEKGAGAFSLRTRSDEWTRVDPGLGLALTHSVSTEQRHVTLEGRVVWEHALADIMPDVQNQFTGGTFEIRGPDFDADRVRVGAGIAWSVSNVTTIRARYDGLFSGDQANHSASLGFNVRF